MAFRYRCYGLDVLAQIDLPELMPARVESEADITITVDRVAEAAAASIAPDMRRDAEFLPVGAEFPGGGAVMEVAGTGRFLVRNGREINAWPAPEADPGVLRIYLIGSAMGMALHQRGLLVMHGAAVVSAHGHATLMIGESGQGKSTLAAHLGRLGHAILCDDTMPVWHLGERFQVWPGSRVFKLWGDTLKTIGESASRVSAIGNRIDKYFVPNGSVADDRPVMLDEIILLDYGDEHSEPRLEPMRGVKALQALAANTYRPGYVALLKREPDHFRQCAALAETVRVWRLVRPWDIGRLDETLNLLARHWRTAPRHHEASQR